MTLLDELKRYTRFTHEDEEALQSVAGLVTAKAEDIAVEFYERLDANPEASGVVHDGAQRARLHATLCQWVRECFAGPWDEAYYHRRMVIGRIHVRVGLPQRYMFGAMDVVRLKLVQVIQESDLDADARGMVLGATHKLLDIELGLMLESYREAFVAKLQRDERDAKALLEKSLAVTNARYDQVVEGADVLITTFDPRGTIALFNARCETLTGIGRSSAAGRDWRSIFGSESDFEMVGALWRTATLRSVSYEGPARCRGEERILRWQFSPMPTDDGPLICALGVDVTEARLLAERTRRSERLAGLGTMAAGLAHEIRNPVNAAQLQCLVLKKKLARLHGSEATEASETAELVLSELRRIDGLVTEFLQFARPRQLVRRPTNLAAPVRSIVSLLSAEADSREVGIELVAPDVLNACVDAESLKQVLHNLIRNAIEASPEHGRVRVELKGLENDALVRVTDEGSGPPDNHERMFEPFFTTKEHGTGLGLAIVHRIVSEHGGRIDVERRDARTTFSVRLPREVFA